MIRQHKPGNTVPLTYRAAAQRLAGKDDHRLLPPDPVNLLALLCGQGLPVIRGPTRSGGDAHLAALLRSLAADPGVRRPGPAPRLCGVARRYLVYPGGDFLHAFGPATWIKATCATSDFLYALLDLCGMAAYLCTTSGRLIWASPIGEYYLDRGPVIVRNPTATIGLRNGAADDELHGSLSRLRHGGRRSPPYGFPVYDNRTNTALSCVVLPIDGIDVSAEAAEQIASVVLWPENQGIPFGPERLARHLGLSPAEGDVVYGLMSGEHLPAIAERRGSTVETIRTYVKSAQRKLGCHSQVELVNRGWRTITIVPTLPGDPSRA